MENTSYAKVELKNACQYVEEHEHDFRGETPAKFRKHCEDEALVTKVAAEIQNTPTYRDYTQEEKSAMIWRLFIDYMWERLA